MPTSSRFRISSKNIFLTYPHCSLTKEEALSIIQNLNTPVSKKYIKICREVHENREPHLHVLIQFEGKYTCTNNRFFDLVSPTRSTHFHPNIQGGKSSSYVKSYIEKHGDTIDWGEFQIDGRSARGGQQSANDVYAEALNSGSKTTALEIIREKRPKDYCSRFHRLNANLDRIFQAPPAIYVSPFVSSTFNNVPDILQDWVEENVVSASGRPDRPMSIVVEGDTRTGKTTWARSLGPHNYLCGDYDLSPKTYNNDAWYNVIDNVDPRYLKHFKEFMGAKSDWLYNRRYGKPFEIKGGIPTIFLCNPGRNSSYKEFLDEDKNVAIKSWALINAIFAFLTQPLFIPGSPPSQANQDEATEEEDCLL
ncbi:unnamed protein product [Lactuca virosa]|uniref:CRESS-DNA virus Rep endonuclease domain-containing protein n=1 Tax=Lactuca virosa TaxID=75947 RepID=A0AAU9NH68_9ASTR|nr:unnamed protein product [Lactuca virosa]